MTESSVIKTCLAFAFAGALASLGMAATTSGDASVTSAPPGATIDFFPVSPTREKGARFIDTKMLPKLGYVVGAPAFQIERLRTVKKIHKTIEKPVESADGKKRTVKNTVPALEITISSADARAFAEFRKKSIGQRVLIEAQGSPIYAAAVRDAQVRTTLILTLADEVQLDEVYGKLARFVKK